MILSMLMWMPLFLFLFAGLLGRPLGGRFVGWTTVLGMGIVLGCSSWLLYQLPPGHVSTVVFCDWFKLGSTAVHFGVQVDFLTTLMFWIVSFIAFLVHLYSMGYMANDRGLGRFMSYLSFFTFAMLVLVGSDNFVQLLLGWEGVGLASYLLIGFWTTRRTATQAAIKAFVVNRVADMALILGIALCFALTGSFDFATLFQALPTLPTEVTCPLGGMAVDPVFLMGTLFFIGAMGKSAQIGFHVWLPDAMEGPTPVSALIHAATMVTAGVFLMIRLAPLLEAAPPLLDGIALVGTLTAVFAGTLALVQTDIKKVIAYSTCSQLGLMFLAIGMEVYSIAFFHLVTHAFFKALLFLGAGSVIHAMSGEQDMRHMGGCWKLIPFTYGMMWIGTLALVGLPWLSGYYSKHLILETTFFSFNPVAGVCFGGALVATLLTALYGTRLMMMTFHGPCQADEKVVAHIHEAPTVMALPLLLLAIGSIFVGALGEPWFVGHLFEVFWAPLVPVMQERILLMEAYHTLTREAAFWTSLPLVLTVLGCGGTLVIYALQPTWWQHLLTRLSGVLDIVRHLYYIDHLYNALFLRPAWTFGYFLSHTVEHKVIEGEGIERVTGLVRWLGSQVRRTQHQTITTYALFLVVILVGLGALICL